MSPTPSGPPPPTTVPESVAVAGAGLAATQTVAALREAGYTGRVVVLGAEGVPPYDRPPLSKHLLDRVTPAWLADEVGTDITALADEVHLDRPARGLVVHGAGVTVHTDHGDLTADAVVVATGAHAHRPDGWTGASTLHTAADAEQLRAALRPGDRLVVVGAGWIGAEVAGVAARADVDVTVVEAAPAPLAAALGPEVGALTTPWYDEHGVRLLTGRQVAAVDGAGVRLADGTTLRADVVLAAVGARPATAWLGASLPREPDGALRVDEGFAVLGAPRHVRAVGDVTLRRSRRHGWVPGGHWDGALRDPTELVADLLHPGATAARADRAPYVFSTQLGHELTLFGQPGADDDVVLRGDPAAGAGWTALWYRPGTDALAAVLTVDRPRDVGAARRLFTTPDLPVLPRTRAADPALPLRA
ncbi:pyridine nucleotide-disulfide oxidoreductase [Cellulomonas sp. A375-1]|uniref:NAD(P)/FAD-dependent oxidoreductase n=1 Tax=Cellulomonas sp. A375-1 TaxID=1672219 RepID=UPI0006527083|nr:FAD-dependent oxidoreductase [Cellulomonas sp. A375-1]KMM45166.1 pyridine nucleotide-disulfide oxidoreductase [Cellulomonas sp. A375-1]